MTDYEYGDRQAELRHYQRELQQLQLGLTSGALTQGEYEDAAAGVRARYGLVDWGTTTNGGP